MLQNDKNWSCYEVSSIPMIYFISDTRGIMGKGIIIFVKIYIYIYFFGIHMCISLLMTCLNQLLPASRNRGAEELKGKEKTNALLPKYVVVSS